MKKGQFYIAMAVFVIMLIALFFTNLYLLNGIGSKKTIQPAQLGGEIAIYSNIKSQIKSLVDNSFIDENSTYNSPDLAGFFSELETDFERRGIDFNYSYLVDSNPLSIVTSKITTDVSSNDVFFHDEFYFTQAKMDVETTVLTKASGMQYYVATFKEAKNDKIIMYNPTDRDVNVTVEFKDVSVETTLSPNENWELYADDDLNYTNGSKIHVAGFSLVYFSRENGTSAPPIDISTTNYIAFVTDGSLDVIYLFNPSRTTDANVTLDFCDDGSCTTQNILIGKFETAEVTVPDIGGVEIISNVGLSVMQGILTGNGVGIDNAVFEPHTEYFSAYSKIGKAVKLRFYNPNDTQSAVVNLYYSGSVTPVVLNLGPNDFAYPPTPPASQGGVHIVSDVPILVTARTASDVESAWVQWLINLNYWFPKFEVDNDTLLFYNPNDSVVTLNVTFDEPLTTDWVYELEAYGFVELDAEDSVSNKYFGPGSILASDNIAVFHYSGGTGVGKGLQVPIIWVPSISDNCDTWIMRYDIILTNKVTGVGLPNAWVSVDVLDNGVVIHTSSTGNAEITDLGEGNYSKVEWGCSPAETSIDIRIFSSLPEYVDIYGLYEDIIF